MNVFDERKMMCGDTGLSGVHFGAVDILGDDNDGKNINWEFGTLKKRGRIDYLCSDKSEKYRKRRF